MQDRPPPEAQTSREPSIEPPVVMTEACKRYFADHRNLLDFVDFVSHLAIRSDEVWTIASEALYDTAHTEEEREKYREQLDRGGEHTQKVLRRFTQLLLQLVASRAADNFLLYVSDLLALVFRTHPETLRSGEQVRFDVILEHERMEDLVAALAERKVETLSYRGMRDVAAWIEDHLGIPLLAEGASLDRVVRIIEVRNLIAHNRAVVNRLFLTRVGDSDASLGSVLHFTVDGVFADSAFLADTVARLDERCVAKFSLPATERGTDLA